MRLFVERTRAGRPEFQLNETNAAAVVQICRRLDGIPLAIELAAARTRILSVVQIAARLDHDFNLLTGINRQALPRHQTLKALIDWSYHLLDAEERILLQRLSIFAGGWTLEAAEQVCSDSQAQVSSGRMVDLIGRLVDKSMVQIEPARGEEPRFRILETVRQYAYDLLDSSVQSPVIRERHLDYFLSLSAQAVPHLRAWRSKDWLDRLEHDLDNFRRALDWSVSLPEGFDSTRLSKGLQLAAGLHWLWWTRNYATEGVNWLVRLLNEQARRSDPQKLDLDGKVARGRAINILIWLYYDCLSIGLTLPVSIATQSLIQESLAIFFGMGETYRRDYALARYCHADKIEITEEAYLACRELFHRANDRFWESESDKDLAIFHDQHGQNFERASLFCEEGLAIKKEIGDLDGQANILHKLSFYELLRGNEDRCVDLKQLCIKTFDQSGNRWFAVSRRCDLANYFIQRGKIEDAAGLLEIAYGLARTQHDSSLIMDCDRVQGYLTLEKGEYEQAIQTCEKVIEMHEDFPYSKIGHIFYILARVALSRGEVFEARADLINMWFQNAFGDSESRLRLVHSLGLLSVQEGRWARAATWLGARDALCAQSYWASHNFSPMECGAYEQARETSRQALGDEAFCAAWEAGHAMSDEQIRAYAERSLFAS